MATGPAARDRYGLWTCLSVAATVAVAAGSSGCGTAAPRMTAPVALPSTGAGSPAPSLPSTAPAGPAAPAARAAPGRPAPDPAALQLAALPVRGRAPRTGYRREAFGQAWADVDRNGCDTRNDVLRRDLTALVLKAGTNGCAVLSGRLGDPYTGLVISFHRGGPSEVDVDHVVALSDAWQTGALRWAPAKLMALANDPANLLAVQAAANRQKGDSDAASWLPPRKAGRCRYVARQIAVKARYGLWVTEAERAAMARVLRTCPGQPQPVPVAVAPTLGTDRRYATCARAVAAGAGPYVRGRDPEYGWYRDADGDGVVCE